MRAWLLSITVLFLSLPTTAAAQFQPFVQCDGTRVQGNTPCDFCYIVAMAKSIVDFLIVMAILIAIIVIVVAGIRLVISRGNEQTLEVVKQHLTNAVVGLILVLTSWLIIDTVMKILVNESVSSGGASLGVWHEITCGSQPRLVEGDYDVPGRITAARAAELGITDMENLSPEAIAAIESGASPADIEARVRNIQNSGEAAEMARQSAIEAGMTPEQADYYVALVQQESSMCQNKTGPQTRYGRAYGCSQMLLSTARGLDPSATPDRLVNDDAYSLTLGAQYFKSRLDMYGGDTTRALAAYNGGTKANNNSTVCPGQLSWQCQRNSGYAETRNYVASIDAMVGSMR